MPTHLRPTGPTAASALLTGDPKRAMDLAAKVMGRPLMSNLSRGLWGYWGHDANGNELTVQSTGIGGPSAAIVLRELTGLGVKRAIRVGTCVALKAGLAPGDRLVIGGALPGDGVGRTADSGGFLPTSPKLTSALGSDPLTVASLDLMAEPGSPTGKAWRARGAAALDLSTAALLATAGGLGVEIGCTLVVAVSVSGEALSHEELDAATLELGEASAGALFRALRQPESPAS
ncbi:MAG: hypothetical protein M3383_04735 [Actinomycetota bacterium]|nr:hypothetical protein [Actinomycetota bacterium]